MVKIIITEEQYRSIQLEAASTPHFQARKTGRLYHIGLPNSDINAVETKLKEVIATDFPKSSAVKLHRFRPDPNHKLYMQLGGRPFYRIPEGIVNTRKKTIVKKSIGDEFWVIIRRNEIKTFLLRRSNDGRTPDEIKKILRVDEVFM